MVERLKKQIQFIVEIDRIKSIFRKTRLFHDPRKENDAEHSWHLAMMAVVLLEHSNKSIDLLKVIKMVLIHDIVEIDTGDQIVYRKDPAKAFVEEKAAAERIFGILPQDQRDEFIGLWLEFEGKNTPESKFAAAIDRLEPVMQNCMNEALAWREHDVKLDQILKANKHIGEGSEILWEYAQDIIGECVEKGWV